jgi:hypothetical protein
VTAPAPYPPPVQAPKGHRRRPGRRGARGSLIAAGGAALAAVVIAAVIVAVVVKRDRPPAGPDPFAGSYPLVGASASAAITWQPSAPPAGPLKKFPGVSSKVIGTISDRKVGLSFAKLAAPWRVAKPVGHSAGIEWDVRKPKFHWWAGAYTDLLRDDFVPASKGPNGLRAAAELEAAKWAKTYTATPIATAGEPLQIDGRSAWLAGYRVPTPDSWDGTTERALVVITVNSGRSVPAVFEISIAKPKYQILPDVNTLVSSLRVIR